MSEVVAPHWAKRQRALSEGKRLVTLLFCGAVVLLVASIVVVYEVGLMRFRAEARMDREALAMARIDEFGSLLKDAETGQRGYLLTGKAPYLEPYNQARKQIDTALKGLRQLSAEPLAEPGKSAPAEPAQTVLSQEQVEKVASLTEAKMAELERTIALLRDQGADAALKVVEEGRGRQLMDQLRDQLSGMRATEAQKAEEAHRQAEQAVNIRVAALLGVAVVNLAFLALAFRKVWREVGLRETAMAESGQRRQLLQTTLASIGDAVIVTNDQGQVSFLNKEAERLTGWSNREAIGQGLREVFRIINEMTRQPVENPVENVLRLGTVAGLANHTLLLSKVGVETPIDDSAAPIREPDGPVQGVVLVFRDVTEQRRGQEARNRLATIVEHSGDVILSKDLNGRIQSWNASAERLFGYRAEEIIGKPVTTFFPPERLQEEDYILGRLREGKAVERLETVRMTKDGRRIPVSVSVSPVKDGEGRVIGASKVIHDISELVAARQALMQEKELLATTLASIGDAVIMTDAEGKVTFLNREAERLTGWATTEAAKRPLPEVFRIINEETRQTVEDPVEKVLSQGKVVGLANHTILLPKSGGEIPIDDSAAPIRRTEGALQGVVLVFRDFTEHKKSEAALREAHAQLADRAVQLEKLVDDRTVKLRDMINELQHVSHSITHDMRAPLRAMTNFASILAEEVSQLPMNTPTHEYCRRIITAATRLDKLIQDSLNYTKAVLQEVPLQPVDLAKLVPELLESYPNLQPAKGSRFWVELRLAAKEVESAKV